MRVRVRGVNGAIEKARQELEKEAVKAANTRLSATVEQAKANVPVVTGTLRDSIGYTPFVSVGSRAKLFAKANYARFVETGTSRFSGRYYLTQAISRVLGVIPKL